MQQPGLDETVSGRFYWVIEKGNIKGKRLNIREKKYDYVYQSNTSVSVMAGFYNFKLDYNKISPDIVREKVSRDCESGQKSGESGPDKQ